MVYQPVETVNHHLAGAGEFSSGDLGNFQPALTNDPGSPGPAHSAGEMV
jgi:hypothetical protein